MGWERTGTPLIVTAARRGARLTDIGALADLGVDALCGFALICLAMCKTSTAGSERDIGNPLHEVLTRAPITRSSLGGFPRALPPHDRAIPKSTREIKPTPVSGAGCDGQDPFQAAEAHLDGSRAGLDGAKAMLQHQSLLTPLYSTY